ncbi:hypothetical protein [Epilithonimonas sp. UC225_85]|uniref:hypothetical protein n=1 Tax=Epilithonimonas sp. UC225_85 TaxID=3350167 RepID=UPI0036D33502
MSITSAIFAGNVVRAFISEDNWINYVGLLFLILGIFGRLIIIKSLGKYFTVDVTIREGHKIKKRRILQYFETPIILCILAYIFRSRIIS